MKTKINRLIAILCILVICFPSAIPAQADTSDQEDNTIAYYTVTITEYPESPEFPETCSARTTYTKTASKVIAYKNSSGTTLWELKMTGTFKYNGTSCTCTKGTASTTDYSPNWKSSVTSCYPSGNNMNANATGKRYSSGTVVETVSRGGTLSCSKYGVIS